MAHPDTSFDRIDCALAWIHALKWVQLQIRTNPTCGEIEKLYNCIEEELKNGS